MLNKLFRIYINYISIILITKHMQIVKKKFLKKPVMFFDFLH
jgi:hypothetical protein